MENKSMREKGFSKILIIICLLLTISLIAFYFIEIAKIQSSSIHKVKKNLSPEPKITINESPIVLDISHNGTQSKSQYEKIVLNYLTSINFPQTLGRGLIILIIDSSFKDQDMVIYNKTFSVGLRGGLALIYYSSAIDYNIVNQESFVLIQIQSTFFPSKFYEPLTHELGHVIGLKLTTSDWQKWASLRGISTSTNTAWRPTAVQDFADVYMIFRLSEYKSGEGIEWRSSVAGMPSGKAESFMDEILVRYK